MLVHAAGNARLMDGKPMISRRIMLLKEFPIKLDEDNRFFMIDIRLDEIPVPADILDQFMIECAMPDVLSDISLFIVGNPIHEISGRAIQAQMILDGNRKEIDAGILTVPFHPVRKYMCLYGHILVRIRCRLNTHCASAHIKDLINSVSQFILHDEASIVAQYIGRENKTSMRLYARNTIIGTDKHGSDIGQMITEPFIQHHEFTELIPANATTFCTTLDLRMPVSRLIFVFTRADENDAFASGILDVLTIGSLSFGFRESSDDTECKKFTEFTWSGKQAHIMDKLAMRAHVPNEAVYTLTFEPNDPHSADAHSLVNFSSGGLWKTIKHLDFQINPQSFPMELRVISIVHNKIIYGGGMATQYSYCA